MMSSSPLVQAMSILDTIAVNKIAHLARLSLSECQAQDSVQNLGKILSMMEQLKTIDTDGIEPLKSPFDNAQPLRQDAATATNQREAYQAVAPSTQAGLYLVPRVIE